jgi:hypothetical protein
MRLSPGRTVLLFFLLASEANSTAGQNDSSSGLIDPDKALLPFQILEETPQEHAIVPPKELSSLRNLTSHVASPCPYGHKLTHSLSIADGYLCTSYDTQIATCKNIFFSQVFNELCFTHKKGMQMPFVGNNKEEL